MDLLAAGKMMGWDTGCKPVARDKYCITVGGRDKKTEFAHKRPHKRLTRTFIRAHKLHSKDSPSKTVTKAFLRN
jgi:hypothetical protein